MKDMLIQIGEAFQALVPMFRRVAEAFRHLHDQMIAALPPRARSHMMKIVRGAYHTERAKMRAFRRVHRLWLAGA